MSRPALYLVRAAPPELRHGIDERLATGARAAGGAWNGHPVDDDGSRFSTTGLEDSVHAYYAARRLSGELRERIKAASRGKCACDTGNIQTTVIEFWKRGIDMKLRNLVVSAGIAVAAQLAVAADAPGRAEDVCPILVGAKVPALVLRDAEGRTYDLAASIARKPTVLIFYRGGWCPYCNLHMAQLQAVERRLVDLGYQILAVSPDRPEKLGAPKEKNALQYVLLSDSEMKASLALGLAYRVDDDTVKKYRGFGIDIEGDSGEKHHLLPVPAALVVGRDGIVKFAYVNPNYKVRVSSEVLLAAAKAALQ